jgi:hypothetical protein
VVVQLQEKLTKLVNDITVTNVLLGIYFATFYGLVFHLLCSSMGFNLSGFLDMAAKVGTIIGGLAALFAAYVAWIGVNTWQRQVKAPIKMELLRDFRELHVLLESLFISVHHEVESIDFCRKEYSNPVHKLLAVSLNHEKTFESLVQQYKQAARVIDHIFNGRINYEDSDSLGWLSDKVSHISLDYFNSLTSCVDTVVDARKIYKQNIFTHFDKITIQLASLENSI